MCPDTSSELEAERNIPALLKALNLRNSEIGEKAADALNRLLNSPGADISTIKFYIKKRARSRLLRSLGITSGVLVTPTESMVNWIPSIVKAIDKRFSPYHNYYCIREHDEIGHRIEQFFEGFCFVSALPYLPYALQSKLITKLAPPTRRVIGHSVSETTWEDAGSIGNVYTVSGTIAYDDVEYTYEPRKPVTYGAKKAALKLKSLSPDLGEKVDILLKRYENIEGIPSRCWKHLREVRQENYTEYESGRIKSGTNL